MKKALAFLLSLCLLLACASFPALAASPVTMESAVASRTLTRNDVTYSASNAIDGDMSTYWTACALWDTVTNGTITFTLKNPADITGLEINWNGDLTSSNNGGVADGHYPYAGGAGSAPAASYTIAYSTDAEGDTFTTLDVDTATTRANNIDVSLTDSYDGLELSAVKRVRITFTGKGTSIREFVAYGIELVPVSYTVKYQDSMGNPLAEDATGEGQNGTQLLLTAPEIEDYLPLERTKTVTLANGENVFVFTYVRSDELMFTIETSGDAVTTATQSPVGVPISFTVDGTAGVEVRDAYDEVIPVTRSGNTYTFTMPASNVTITAKAGTLVNAATSAIPSRVTPASGTWNPWLGSTLTVNGAEYTTCDGSESTMWFLQRDSLGKTVLYDLGTEYLLSDLKMSFNGSSTDFSATLEGSLDGENWYSVANNAITTSSPSTDAFGRVRYVRFTIADGDALSLSLKEFYINGVPTADTVYTVPATMGVGSFADSATSMRTALAAGEKLVVRVNGFDDLTWLKDAYLVTASGEIKLERMWRTDKNSYQSRDVDLNNKNVWFTATMPAENVTGIRVDYYEGLVALDMVDSDWYDTGRRADDNPFKLVWTGSSIEAEVSGTSTIGFIINSSAGNAQFAVQVDGAYIADQFSVNAGETRVFVRLNELDPTVPHTVRLIRHSQRWVSAFEVTKVIVDEGATLTPNFNPDYKLKIEILGDSITCSQGNDFTNGYSFRIGEFLHAESSIVAAGGAGMYASGRNGHLVFNPDGTLQKDGDSYVVVRDDGSSEAPSTNLIPIFYDMADQYAQSGSYDYSFHPDLIVINLGTNDSGQVYDENNADTTTTEGLKAGSRHFVETYLQFLEHAYEVNTTDEGGKPKILLTCGLMSVYMEAECNEVIARFKEAHPEAEISYHKLDPKYDHTQHTAITDGHPGPLSMEHAALDLSEEIRALFPELYQTEDTAAVKSPVANIRLPQTGISEGLRFKTTFEKDSQFMSLFGTGEYSFGADADVEFGTLILPQKHLGSYTSLQEYFLAKEAGSNASGKNVLNILAENIYAQDAQTVEFTGVLIDIPEARYNTELVSVGYVRYRSSADKAWHYIFAPTEKVMSYADVALTARQHDYSDQNIAAQTDTTVKAQMQAAADKLDAILTVAGIR